MNAKTEALMNKMVAFAREGNDIIPMYWQPRIGASNTVSAAIRAAKKRSLLVQNGVDGVGKPKYAAVIPAATHTGTEVVQ
jgi:hypothetical protein